MENQPEETGEAPKPKRRVHFEKAKQRQVSHWDLDYLPSGEIEEAFAEGERQCDGEP